MFGHRKNGLRDHFGTALRGATKAHGHLTGPFLCLVAQCIPQQAGHPIRMHSSREIVTGQSLSWDKHRKACFGDFIQAPYDHKGPGMPTNCVNEM